MENFFHEIESSYIYMRQGGGLGEPQGNKTLQCQFLSHQETFSWTLNFSWCPTKCFFFSRNIQLTFFLDVTEWQNISHQQTFSGTWPVICLHSCDFVKQERVGFMCIASIDTVYIRNPELMLLSALVGVLWKEKKWSRDSEKRWVFCQEEQLLNTVQNERYAFLMQLMSTFDSGL